MRPPTMTPPLSVRKQALKIAGIYALFGLLWILFSDQLLLLLTTDANLLAKIQTIKGWLFIAVTGSLLYALVHRALISQHRDAISVRLSDERFRAIFDGVNDGIFLQDIETGAIREVNAKAEEMYGYSREEMTKLTIADLSENDPAYSQQETLALLKKVQQKESLTFEWRARHRNGSLFWVEISMRRAELLGVPTNLVSIRNINNRKQAEKMGALGVLAGGIAHDFNNLLSIIIGNTEMVSHKLHDDCHVEKNIERVKNAAQRAADLTKQILTFSRNEQKDLQPLRPAAIIHDSLQLLRSTIPTSIEIVAKFSTDAENAVITADETQLQQVLFNLCTNAVHAMDEKGQLYIDMTLIAATDLDLPDNLRRPAKDYICLSVGDTGQGMTKQLIDQAFDPFFTTKNVGKGTGMGLAVVHGIIVNHDGFIATESEPGKGSTFRIYLPLTRQVVPHAQFPEKHALPRGTEQILLIDDEVDLADSLKEMLEPLGYRVTVATQSVAALRMLLENPDRFQLIVTDQTMPDLSGSEFAKKALQLNDKLPIILCSGYSAKVSESEAKAIGIREFCMKPLDEGQLALMIRKVLDETHRAY